MVEKAPVSRTAPLGTAVSASGEAETADDDAGVDVDEEEEEEEEDVSSAWIVGVDEIVTVDDYYRVKFEDIERHPVDRAALVKEYLQGLM